MRPTELERAPRTTTNVLSNHLLQANNKVSLDVGPESRSDQCAAIPLSPVPSGAALGGPRAPVRDVSPHTRPHSPQYTRFRKAEARGEAANQLRLHCGKKCAPKEMRAQTVRGLRPTLGASRLVATRSGDRPTDQSWSSFYACAHDDALAQAKWTRTRFCRCPFSAEDPLS